MFHYESSTALPCPTMGTEVLAQCGCDGHQVLLVAQNGPGKKKWVVFEDDPPTKVSEQNCFKVHAHGGVRKYGTTPLFVNVGSKGGRATSKRVNGVVDPILVYDTRV